MERAIEFIKNYVAVCADCQLAREARCGYIFYDGKIPSIDNNPYMQDGIMKCSSEQKAFLIAEKRGNPCNDQEDLEQFLRNLESQLDKAYIPEECAELLTLIGKFKRVSSIYLRRGDAFSAVFGDIVDAAIDKCLARIDYHYLELGINLGDAIKLVSGNNARFQSLREMYPEQIIISYIKNATVIGIDDLTRNRGQITDVAHNIKLELDRRKEKHKLGDRNMDCTAIKELRWIFSNELNEKLVQAFLVEFGYKDVAGIDPSEVLNIEDIFFSYTDTEYARYIRWEEFKVELDYALKRDMVDGVQMLKYLQSLVTSVKDVAKYFYPTQCDEMHKEAATLLRFLASIEVCSYKPIVDIWKRAKLEAHQRMEQEDLSFEGYLDVLERVAIDMANEECVKNVNNEITILSSLHSNMNKMAMQIAAAFLRNYIDYTVEDLQESCNVWISPKVTDIMLVLDIDINMSLEEIEKYREDAGIFNISKNCEQESISDNNTKSVENVKSLQAKSYPLIIDKMILKLPKYYTNGDDGAIVFKGKTHKEYALWLRELFRFIYKPTKTSFQVRRNKLPIHPLSTGELLTSAQLSQGRRGIDELADLGLIEEYRTAIKNAYEEVIAEQNNVRSKHHN